MKKAILLDRDGTINVEKDYLHKVEDFEFEKNVIKNEVVEYRSLEDLY